MAIEENFAGRSLNEPGDHFHGGGLAGPVRAQVSRDLTGARLETYVIHGRDAAESFGDIAQFKRHDCRPPKTARKRRLPERDRSRNRPARATALAENSCPTFPRYAAARVRASTSTRRRTIPGTSPTECRCEPGG